MIDDAGRADACRAISGPRLIEIVGRRFYQPSLSDEPSAQVIDCDPVRPAGCCIAAFKKHKRGGYDWARGSNQFAENGFCALMPLIRFVPGGDEADCIQKHLGHG